MNNKAKTVLMDAVVKGSLRDVERACKEHNVVFDKNYFDYELLQAALVRKHQSIILFLINKIGCRPSNPSKVSSEETILYLAMKFNNDFIIKTILRKGASMYDKNHNGETPLHTAYKEKNLDAVRTLLTYSKPNRVPENNDDILHFHIACVTNHKPAVERYLEYGVDPNKPLSLDSAEYAGLNPVQFTAEKNHFELFEKLVYHGGDLSIKNANGLTPLHIVYYLSPSEVRISRIRQTFKNGNDTKFINSVDSNRLSHFHLCCTLNEPDFVQCFIDNGVNVNSSISLNCSIDPGFTPLHFAVINGCERVVELLLKNGANCNKKDKEGQTPLHLACKISGYWKAHIIKMLLDYKASPIIADKEGNTPLHMEFYYVNSVNKLIFDMLSSKMSRKVNFTNNEGLSLFHIACATNDINRVKDFLNSGVKVNSSVSSGMYRGYTALHFAVLHNRKDVVVLLLKKNAQVNIKATCFQITPLHLACEFNYMKFHEENAKYHLENFKAFPINLNSTSNRTNQLDIIKLLLSHDALIDAQDTLGITPLLHTSRIDKNYSKLKWCYLSDDYNRLEREAFIKEISSRLKEIIEILLSKKANVKAHSNTQETILHNIAKCNTLKITEKLIKLILTEGADIDAVDCYGFTPLHVSVEFSNKRLVRILLKYKANINAKCLHSKKIPLHVVIGLGLKDCHQKEIFFTLLENGSDVNARCEDKTLIRNVNEDQYFFIIQKLLDYGADINVKDSIVHSCVISTLVKWKSQISSGWCFIEEVFVDLFKIIFTHVQKLLALELHVNQEVQDFCRYVLYPCYEAICFSTTDYDNLNNIYDDCVKELEKMKLIKIDNYTSLYSILLKDSHNLSKCVRNSSFIEIIQAKNLEKEFPLYSYLLKLQFRRGSIKNDILQSAKASLTNVINLDLPDLVVDCIMKYLTNEEIATLNVAVPLKSGLKRKLNDNDTNQAVLPKLQKTRENCKRK